MLTVFEVVISPHADADAILGPEVLEETMAQVMTIDEASAVGFQGVQPDPDGNQVRLVAVSPKDARFIESRLEANADVRGYRKHEVET